MLYSGAMMVSISCRKYGPFVSRGNIEVLLNYFTLLRPVTEMFLFEILITVDGPSQRLEFSR